MAGRRGGTRVLFRRARTRINTPSNPWGVFREGPGGHVPHLLEGGEHSMFPPYFWPPLSWSPSNALCKTQPCVPPWALILGANDVAQCFEGWGTLYQMPPSPSKCYKSEKHHSLHFELSLIMALRKEWWLFHSLRGVSLQDRVENHSTRCKLQSKRVETRSK